MKIAHVTLSVALTVFLFLFGGCTARETTSNTAARATAPPVSNANATVNSNPSAPAAGSNSNADATRTSAASDEPKPKSIPQLIGTYESREVEKEGVVTVISKLRTVWMFAADGNYSRVSQVNGKTYHSDSGVFRIEAPDNLVLTIQVTGLKANRKIQNPAVVKTHKYSLSPDGDELRLISEKGAVGIFQRVSKPS
jgi:hypothetical protein